MALDPPGWMKLKAAAAYRDLGDLARAGELALAALPSTREVLATLPPDELEEGDRVLTDGLVKAWRLVGEGAAAAGDVARAEKYLDAAWRVGFSPEAGWALGDLRERQGRLADAVELWSMAAAVPTAPVHLPEDRQARIEAACRMLPAAGPPAPAPRPATPSFVEVVAAKPPRQAAAEARLTELRTVRLAGPSLADLAGDVLLLADAGGRVERILRLSKKDAKAFDRQIASLGPIRLPSSRPDEEPFKVVLRALLACSIAAGCALVLDLPGLMRVGDDGPGSIRIVSLDPKDGVELVRGQRVTLIARVGYEIRGDVGVVGLVIQDSGGRLLTDTPVSEMVSTRSGTLTLTAEFTVPEDATRIEVFVPLLCPTTASTTTVAAARYGVKAR
jgi:hypothetical protein